MGLFVRPIRPEAWYASLLLTLVMVLMVLIPFLWNADYDSAESSMITQVRLEKNTSLSKNFVHGIALFTFKYD